MNYSKRIKNVFLLARVILKWLFSGPANKAPKNISRIIIVPTGKLGDVVCTTPVFKAARSYFPQAHLISIGDYKLHRAVLADSSLADEYLPIAQADMVLLTGPSFELAAPLYLLGIPLMIAPEVVGGVSPQATRPYKILTRFLKTYPYKMGEYAPRERLRCFEPLGITADDATKCLGFSSLADARVGEFFVKNDINLAKDFVVGVTPTAGHKIKEWPEDRFAEIIDYLASFHRAKVVILGGPNDKSKVDKVKSLVKSQTGVLSATDFNIDELKAFISKLRAFISVDTGPIYIAEAFNIPTIDITGPIDEKEQPPRGILHRNVIPPDRLRPELFVLNAKTYDRDEALRQVQSITVSMVKQEIDQLIKDIGRSK